MNRTTARSTALLTVALALLLAVPALAAPRNAAVYRSVGGLDSRTVVWVVAELHLMFAAFVLGVPIFAAILELVGVRGGDARYDRLAHELTRLLSAAFSTTAALGGTLAFVLVGLYPSFMQALGEAVHQSFYVYAALFFAEAFTLYLYYYGWERMQSRTPNAPALRRPAWGLTLALAFLVIALMLFHGGDTRQPRAAGAAAAARIGAIANGMDELVRAEAAKGRARAQTDVKNWRKRIETQVDRVAVDRPEGLHAQAVAGDEKAVSRAGAVVLGVVLDTLRNAPKNASAERIAARFKHQVAVAQGAAKLEGDNRASAISAAHWTVVGAGGLALLVALAVASWASGPKSLHLFLGLTLNLAGIALMMIANAWTTFMMSPAGYNEATLEFGGTTWTAIANPLWQPLNLHRLLANIVFGGFVSAAYAAVRFLGAKTDEERAHYDWMGYVGNFVGILAMIPLPFAGYLLGREIYSNSPIMGNNMMGGAFSWAFIFQAVLIGMLFLGANYYLWIGMERIPGSERYRRFIPWYAVILLISFAVWVTPHNLPLSAEERALMGGAQYHPLLKYLGLMPAKNAVVNLIILTTFFCFLMYRRAGCGTLRPFSAQGKKAKLLLGASLLFVLMLLGWYGWVILRIDLADISVPAGKRWVLSWAAGSLGLEMVLATVAAWLTARDRGKVGQGIYFAGTALLVAGFLGVWGFVTMVHANPFLRNIAVCQVLMVLSAMILCGAIDLILLNGAEQVAGIRWGQMPARSQYALLVVTVAVVQLMGLMGFIRSALREDWHLYGVLRDTSQGAGTPSLAHMSWVVALISLVFFALLAFVFWLGGLSEAHARRPDDRSGRSAQEAVA
ncbi:MAG: cytochrome ubiquinol oxidase subunit I [Candidatus Binatia bacterium]